MPKNNGVSRFYLKHGDAQRGELATIWDRSQPMLPSKHYKEPRPLPINGGLVLNPPLIGYSPMKLEGAIVLGIGGAGSNAAVGPLFEGAMIRGVADDATDAAIQANVVQAQYQKLVD